MTHPIEIKELSFRYQGSTSKILDGINLSVSKGEVLAIVGLSGTGKSTLCYCIAGIIPHIYNGTMTGEVCLNGISTKKLALPQIATVLGIVFQSPDTQLFSPTVEDEIAFGPENLCLPREEIIRRVDAVLTKVGMQKYRKSEPHQLSGGQKQLIALASVLSLEPEIIIFDEAMSQIDTAGKAMIKEMILNLKQEGRTIVMIEHDFANLDIADRILLLKENKLIAFNGKLS